MAQAAPRARNSATEEALKLGGRAARITGMLFLLLTISIIIASIVAVLIWMNDANRLPLSKLVITGDRHHISNNEIRQAVLSLGVPGTFMSQDVNILQHQIERLPWVKRVSIRKQWPDILKIHLTEYQPLARWNDLQLIDKQGVVFNVTNLESDKLPLLYGPSGCEQEVIEGWQKMGEILRSINIELKAVSMTARRSWQLITRDDVRIELGRADIEKRLERLIDLYPVIMDRVSSKQSRIDYIDLRYDAGAAIMESPSFLDKQQGNRQQHQTQAKR